MALVHEGKACQGIWASSGKQPWQKRTAHKRLGAPVVRRLEFVAGCNASSRKHIHFSGPRLWRSQRNSIIPRAESDESEEPVAFNTEFGYSRKDVILIGIAVIAAGFAVKYGLEVAGVDPVQAGTYAQLAIFVGVLVSWIVTYVFRVSSKEMTYVRQLKVYEDQVMQKRLDEMTDVEKDNVIAEIEDAKKD